MKKLVIIASCLIALLIVRTGPAAETESPATVAPGAVLVEVHSDKSFFEGPTWDPKTEKLYFTSFFSDDQGKPNQQILRLDSPGKVTLWMDHSEGVNGTYLSLTGRLLGAQAYGHRIVEYGFGPDGPSDPKALLFDDGLHQPNDVCQTPSGDIYFTDPDFENRKTSAVYRLAKGKATKVIDDMPVPNGVIASLDGKTLYVGDSHLKLWRAYPIGEDGRVGAGRAFFNPDTENVNSPDGMSIDERGNLYVSGRGGVWVASPTGQSLGLIDVPEFCSNVTFGGADGKTLYLTCSNKVYSLKMQVRGGQLSR